MTVGAVILAGGKSSRMKVSNKALLLWNGRSFLERLLWEMQGFKELLISADRSDRYPEYANRVVPDKFPGIGPIGALYSVLSICQSDAMIVTACDTPFFSKGLAEYLLSYLSYEWDAVVVEDCSGRIHPLCGIYQKAALPFFLEQIQSGDYKQKLFIGQIYVADPLDLLEPVVDGVTMDEQHLGCPDFVEACLGIGPQRIEQLHSFLSVIRG